MKITELLRRYHISPLQYENGTELKENDYKDLFTFLQLYNIINNELNGASDEEYLKCKEKIKSIVSSSLIELNVEDVMDIVIK